jgi:hypothetical protein
MKPGSPGRASCLRSGECAAATLDQPAIFEALAVGFHARGVTNENRPSALPLDIANPVWAAAHRDLVAKYVRVTTAAMRFSQDAGNRDEVLKVRIGLMKQPENLRVRCSPISGVGNIAFSKRQLRIEQYQSGECAAGRG